MINLTEALERRRKPPEPVLLEGWSGNGFDEPDDLLSLDLGSALHRRSRPRVRRKLSEWMESHVTMDRRTKRPGPLHLEDWQREPMDAMIDPTVRLLLFKWFSQSLKTTGVCSRLMWGIMETDEKALLLAPTRTVIKRFIRKFDDFLASVPEVSNIIKKNRDGGAYWDDGIRTTDGRLPVEFGTSYAVSGMISLSANLVLFDEYDSAKASPGAGSPFDLAFQRGQQMAEPLTLLESTPGIEGESHMDEDFERTSSIERFSTCIMPRCKEKMFIDVDIIHKLESGWHIVCPECGYIYEEADRQRLIKDQYSYWEATNPDAPEGWRGYHINQFHSAIMSVDETMQTFRENNQKGFTTQVRALSYKREDIPPLEPEDLLSLHGPPPEGTPLAVTMGVDSQFGKNARFECSIVEWHGDRALPTPYVRNHIVVLVDGENWREAAREVGKLSRLCDMTFWDIGSNEGGDKVKTLIRTQLPHDFRQGRIKAIKGVETPDWESTEVIQGGYRHGDQRRFDYTVSVYSTIARLVAVHHLADGTIILRDAVSEFPSGYHSQLASHWVDFVTSPTGIERKRWRQKSNARDEALDCLMYAYCAYRYLGPTYVSQRHGRINQQVLFDVLGV